jgi:hypothetical protein
VAPVSLPRTRVVLVIFTVCLALVAWGLHESEATEVLWPSFWPWYFAGAAIATAIYAVAMDRTSFLISGFLVPAGFLLRVPATAARVQEDLIDKGRLLINLGLFTMAALTAAIVWVYVLGPITELHHRR